MKILVVEPDTSVRLMACHALESFQHEPLAAESVAAAGALLRNRSPEALILASSVVPRADARAHQVTSVLSGGRTLPVLLLVEAEDDLADADAPTLEKPFTAEAFIARVEQVLTEQPEAPDWETGVLTGNQLLEVLQSLEQRRLSGHVRLVANRSHGLIEISDGRVAGARFGLLREADAMLAMMQLPAAFYSFEATEIGRPDDDASILDLADLTLQMARIEGELARHGKHLPRVDQPLVTVAEVPPDGTYAAPIIEVHERIHFLPGITMEDLLAQEVASPARVRLAVALLFRFGTIGTIAS